MARKRKLTLRQRVKEQPVLVLRLAALLVSSVATFAGLDLTPEQKEAAILIFLMLAGVELPTTLGQWLSVAPEAKRRRLERERRNPPAPAPTVDEETSERMGGIG